MKKSDIKMLEDFDNHLIEWTEEFEKMIIENICPKCEWEPDCGDYIISYGPKEYSYHLSLLSSLIDIVGLVSLSLIEESFVASQSSKIKHNLFPS